SARTLCDAGEPTLFLGAVGTTHAGESATRHRRPSLRPRTPSSSASVPPSAARTARRSRDLRKAAGVQPKQSAGTWTESHRMLAAVWVGLLTASSWPRGAGPHADSAQGRVLRAPSRPT